MNDVAMLTCVDALRAPLGSWWRTILAEIVLIEAEEEMSRRIKINSWRYTTTARVYKQL